MTLPSPLGPALSGPGPSGARAAAPLARLPFLTAHAGCGGRLKQTPEDFRVEELPLYRPGGSGEHLYLLVEKRGLTTPALLAHLRRALQVPPQALGHAGLKDAQAVTRQWISVHSRADLPLEGVETPALRILEVSRHTNKLRRGHLAGNRFAVVLRGALPPPGFADLLNTLSHRGFPNYFGPQRFGARGDNGPRGRALLLGQAQPGRGRIPPETRRFLINAYQAALFNRLLATRLAALGRLDTLLPGDRAVLHANGASVAVDDAGLAAAQARADDRELSPSAPLFGYKTPLAEGRPGQWERDLLAEEGLALETFRLGGKKDSPAGERRPVRALPADLACEALALDDGPALRLSFTLPAGVYATSLLREAMQTAATPPDSAEGDDG
jgi:tRNA pseudouridine13 synthase